jgi:RNA-directed DNA polymerase
MTALAFAVAMAALGVNGPEGEVLDWDAVTWRRHEDNVRRLRQRIFKAVQEGDLAKVRNLQRLMLRSWSNTLVSVRQATQRNAGRKTAGIDGEVALTSSARMELAVRVHSQLDTWQPRAVKRVYIPKAGNRAKLRPLGIPVIADRCHQSRVRNALEPEWEARFEPRSYGFRPGRSCQDAAQAIYMTCKGSRAKRVWALDADLASAFDKLDHDRLLEALGSFPARDLIRDWLRAGVFEAGKGFAPTEEGTPQGGVITPPTQSRTSCLRSRWVTGVWSVVGDAGRHAGSSGVDRGGSGRLRAGRGAAAGPGGGADGRGLGRLGRADR